MSLSLPEFLSFYGGTATTLISQADLTTLANATIGTRNSLTALAGGGQPGATILSPGFNEIDTIAAGSDSVQLPAAIPGVLVWIAGNAATNALAIYANAGGNSANAGVLDQMIAINTVTKTAAASSISLSAGHSTLFVCMTLGVFKQIF